MKKPGELTHVEFRTECEPPTEPGWYWAAGAVTYNEIVPVNFDEDGDVVFPFSRTNLYHCPDDFRWYGPVTMVKAK